MVNWKLILIVLSYFFSPIAIATQDIYEDEKVYEPRPYAMTAITSLAIQTINKKTACQNFTLKKSDIREFFSKARRASKREYVHDLDMSPCSISGKISFANGDTGHWNIDQNGRGIITLSNAQNLYFYCLKCSAFGDKINERLVENLSLQTSFERMSLFLEKEMGVTITELGIPKPLALQYWQTATETILPGKNITELNGIHAFQAMVVFLKKYAKTNPPEKSIILLKKLNPNKSGTSFDPSIEEKWAIYWSDGLL